MKPAPTIRFKVQLPEGKSPKGGASVLLPKGAAGKLPKQGAIVEGTINTFPFRAPIAATPNGQALKLSQAIQEGVRHVAAVDDTVNVEITRVGDEREIRVPADFAKSLGGNSSALETWADITPISRREWVLFISTAKLADTRKKRIEKACDMLSKGKRRVCCFPGLKWLTKDHPDAETWLPLIDNKKQA